MRTCEIHRTGQQGRRYGERRRLEIPRSLPCGIYPADGAKYPDLKDALEKLQLNDASLTFELETSAALGFGFRCGFLGLLHMEIITERLEREFDLDIITTTPSVRYRLTMTDGTVEMIDNPSSYPDPSNIVKQEEPFVDEMCIRDRSAPMPTAS